MEKLLATKKQHAPQSPLYRGEAKNADTAALERQIDEMVGQAQRLCPYNGLMPEEIAIVDGKGCPISHWPLF